MSLRFAVPLDELHLRAVVRYQKEFDHGREFLPLTDAEHVAIQCFCNERPWFS